MGIFSVFEGLRQDWLTVAKCTNGSVAAPTPVPACALGLVNLGISNPRTEKGFPHY